MPLYIEPMPVIKANLGIQNGGPVHAFFTDACAKAMDRFVPFDTGTLAETAVLKNGDVNRANVTVDTITYNQEYATYVYYGELMVDAETGSAWAKKGHKKVLAGKNLTYNTDKHQDATSYWDEHMWTAKGDDIVKQTQKYMDKYGGK